MTFKPHIEGLRALAILPILLFHLDPKWCPGGFIGVDVFFVISGYLISGLILAEGPSLDFYAFYKRRFFRLFPALLVTILGTMVAGWSVLSPSAYLGTAYSGLAASIGGANIYFWWTIDYFDADALAHPLLHTWSLAVEEQFYLIWPALLVLAARWRAVPLVVATVAVASFAAMLAARQHIPEATFYLTPFRMFELALGALVALMEPRLRRLPAGMAPPLAVLGLLLVAGSAILLDKATAWPGAATLPCLVGTALLILYGASAPAASLLNAAPVRYLGRISYSVYLVHWPLIAIYRTYTVIEPSLTELLALGAGALLLGATLHALVEVPFQLRTARQTSSSKQATARWQTLRLPARHRAGLAGLLVTCALASCAWIVAGNGIPSRLNNGRVEAHGAALTFAGDLCNSRWSRCQFGDPSSDHAVYLVGDSMALNWVYGLDGSFRQARIEGIALYDYGCLFAYGTRRFQNGIPDKKCGRNVAEAYAHLSRTSAPVIIAGDWSGYRNDIGAHDAAAPLRQDRDTYFAYVEERLAAGLDVIGAASRPVVIVLSGYSTGVDIAKCLMQPGAVGSGSATCKPQSRSAALAAVADADRMLTRLASRYPNVVLIDPKPVFCPTEDCIVEGAGGLYFRDPGHLTNAGSRFLVEKVEGMLRPLLQRSAR